MSGDLSKFEVDSTKTPLWLPIAGVVLFFILVVVAMTCPGERQAIPDGGAQAGQSQ